MKRLRLLLCLLMTLSAGICAAADTTQVSFHTYGLVRGGSDAPRTIVARRWHIEYLTVAGCVVTEGLIDSARVHNERSEAILAKRHGSDWRRRFDAEVESETLRQAAITRKLDSSAEIRSLRAKLKADYNTPWYRFDFDEQHKVYTVEVKAWSKKAKDYATYYLLTAGRNRWELVAI